MLKIDHLTKRYSHTLAVDDLDFEVEPGVVTGFLGPNGSGKSTTMRIILARLAIISVRWRLRTRSSVRE